MLHVPYENMNEDLEDEDDDNEDQDSEIDEDNDDEDDESPYDLILFWMIPESIEGPYFHQTTANLFKYILEMKNEVGLLNDLKNERWVKDIDIGIKDANIYTTAVTIRFSLTKIGVKNVDNVILKFYVYVANLNSHGIPKNILDELKGIKSKDKLVFIDDSSTHQQELDDLNELLQKNEISPQAYERKVHLTNLLSEQQLHNNFYILLQEADEPEVSLFAKKALTVSTELPICIPDDSFKSFLALIGPRDCTFALITPKEFEVEDKGIAMQTRTGIQYTSRPISESVLSAWEQQKH